MASEDDQEEKEFQEYKAGLERRNHELASVIIQSSRVFSTNIHGIPLLRPLSPRSYRRAIDTQQREYLLQQEERLVEESRTTLSQGRESVMRLSQCGRQFLLFSAEDIC